MVAAVLGCQGYQPSELMLDKVVEVLQKGMAPLLWHAAFVMLLFYLSRRVEKGARRETTKSK